MSREIKFRGKRVDTGEWIYGYLVQSKPFADGKRQAWIIEESIMPFGATSTPTEKFVQVDPETVGQFIGCQDKKKKDIYEKDIIGRPDRLGRGYGVIQFACGVFGANWQYSENQNPEWSKGSMFGGWGSLHNLRRLDDDILDDFEVIGNLSDNPEVLNKAVEE